MKNDDYSKDIAIAYHYVKERGGWKGIFPLSPHEFEQQLNILSKQYQIVSIEDFFAVKKNRKPRCLLTFDDGTKDQYEIAFDILRKKSMPAYFAIMSGPLQEKRIPIVHLVHTVLSFYPDEEIWKKLSAKYDTQDIDKKSQCYEYELNVYRRYSKCMLNAMLSQQEARYFLEDLFYSVFPDTEKFINDYYINENELRAMISVGMTIGVHCHNHIFYHGDAARFYQEEIEPCKKYLEKEIGIIPKWYTPAFGGGLKLREMQQDLTPILLKNGFVGAFTTVQKNIDHPSFWLDRFDCNNFPPKKYTYINELSLTI